MACRFATWPTSRSPVFVNATTDGVTRPPSAFGMIVGSPASMYATAELVVPRSMPMTFAMCLLLLVPLILARGGPARSAQVLDLVASRLGLRARGYGPPRDGHQRRADDAVVKLVGLADLVDDGAFGRIGVDVSDGLVDVRIEWLPEGADLFEAFGGEDLAELAVDESHAFAPRLPLHLRGDVLEGAVEAVEDVEQLRDQLRLREAREVRALGLVAAAVVREVGALALQVVRELIDLRLGLVARPDGAILIHHALPGRARDRSSGRPRSGQHRWSAGSPCASGRRRRCTRRVRAPVHTVR